MNTRLNMIAMVGVALSCGLGVVAPAEAQTFVGSWDLANLEGNYNNPNNPYLWHNNPMVYSAVEAAAVLFGGNPDDYVISTIDSNPVNINHLAFLDGWGDTQFLYNPQSETFKMDSGAPGYNAPYGGPAYSALVTDHAPFEGRSFVNYAFRVDGRNSAQDVPEPGSIALLMGMSACGLGLLRRRRKSGVL